MMSLFFGCLFVAFGPAAVFLLEVVLHHSHLTVLTIVAAFFELIAFLLTSVIWFLIPSGFQGRTATALVVGVFLQECLRLLFVYSYGRGELGLSKASGMFVLPFTDFSSAISAGFGFGLMYALLMFGGVLGLSVGEADFFPSSCPKSSIFVVEAFATLAMQLEHVALMVLAFDGWRRRKNFSSRIPRLFTVFTLHLLASLSTLLNMDAASGGCSLGLPLLYLVMLITVLYTIKIVREEGYHVRGDLRTSHNGDSVQPTHAEEANAN